MLHKYLAKEFPEKSFYMPDSCYGYQLMKHLKKEKLCIIVIRGDLSGTEKVLKGGMNLTMLKS